MLLAEIKNIFRKELRDYYPVQEIDTFFYHLIEHYLNLERFVLVMQPQLSVTKEEQQPLFESLSHLKAERPIQYIIGESLFMDLTLKVNEHVLIPRPETEELVRWVLNECNAQQSQIRILDIGTGSGCIAITLAKKLERADVDAMDISDKALEVAVDNAKSNQAKVHFFEGDILNQKPKEAISAEYDVIVSNPPYVRHKEKKEIRNNVKRYEPSKALFVPNENPLLFYDAIARFSSKYLRPEGKLFLEINQYLAEETKTLFECYNFSEIEVRKDFFGNDRMLKAVKK